MAQAAAIKPSPHDPGVYYISGQTWAVGARYTLVKLLGEGSFSQVCLALDNETGEHVAVKRIPDVLASLDNAKRVLREVCILRRMLHPGIVSLKDVFLRPASTGRCVYRRGQLVPTSLDLYLALEYCDQGDLFHVRGQISEAEVKSIMLQLLQALQYLHDNGVWHRDVKTANILVTYSDGARLVKIADLGSARSAADSESPASPPARRARARAAGPFALGAGPGAAAAAPAAAGDGGAAGAAAALAAVAISGGGDEGGGGDAGCRAHQQASVAGEGMRHSDSFMVDAAPSRSELFARPAAGGGAGFQPPLTRMVCTPCYRAPEVVMSRGQYTSAIDVWGAGCVFGELLQRVPWLGKAATPHLQVAPVFALHGMPLTPEPGERFGSKEGARDSVTRQELKALFQVTGTPSWKCIEGVPSKAWRDYLRRIPGRAPTLYRRFGAAGEVAVDLLQRLLTFDPDRRPSCEEAMAHEYFSDLRAAAAAEAGVDAEQAAASGPRQAAGAWGGGDDPAAQSGAEGEGEPGAAAAAARGVAMTVDEPEGAEVEAAEAADAGSGGGGSDADMEDGGAEGGAEAQAAGGAGGCRIPLVMRARMHSGGGGGGGDAREPRALDARTSFVDGDRGDHYYDIDDPAVALAKLEEEMGGLLQTADPETPSGAGGPAADAFRELLEREVAEHSAHLEARRARGSGAALAAAAAAAAAAVDPAGSGGGAPGGAGVAAPRPRAAAAPPPRYPASAAAAAAAAARRAGAGGGIGRMERWERCRQDPGRAVDPSVLALRRLPHHADAEQAHLEAELHLRAGRHGEWAAEALRAGPRTGGAWGVTLLPPGCEEGAHPDIADVVRSQNRR